MGKFRDRLEDLAYAIIGAIMLGGILAVPIGVISLAVFLFKLAFGG